jgi:hypothetical protein
LLPTAHEASKVHFSRAKACPLRSVLRVWVPSRRFSPFGAVPALFNAGGAHGIRPSELSPLGRFPRVSARVGPPTVSPSGVSRRPKASGRPNGLRFLGCDPSESPLRSGECLARRLPDAPLGFVLLRLAGQGLVQVFAGLLSRASAGRPQRPCSVRPRVSIGHGLVPSSVGVRTASDETAFLGFLRRLGPDHLNCRRLRAMRSPLAAATSLPPSRGL